MKRISLFASAILVAGSLSFLSSCNNAPKSQEAEININGEQQATEQLTVKFTTEKEEFMGTIKASFDIRLDREASEEELLIIAKSIKEKHPNYERYFITYYLPSYTIGSGAWATSHIESGEPLINIVRSQD